MACWASPHGQTGTDLQRLSDEALWRVAESTDLFVEVDPNQKDRIILASRRWGTSSASSATA
jgi:magnesium-transporting ATPase (P-type)